MSKKNNWKSREGIVYSTSEDFTYAHQQNEEAWQGNTGTITAPGILHPTRDLLVRYCPISYLAFK